MTCDDVIDALTLATSPADAATLPPDVTAHLAACPACRAEQQSLLALAARVRADLAPVDGPTPPPFEAIAARLAPRSRAPGLLLRACALITAAALGALADRAWFRGPAPVSTPAPAPATAPPPDTHRQRAREAIAANPGGLTAALAALDSLSSRER